MIFLDATQCHSKRILHPNSFATYSTSIFIDLSQLTVLMREHSGADAAWPHPQRRGRGQLRGHLRVARQVLAQGSLVHVELPAHRARVVGVAPLGYGENG